MIMGYVTIISMSIGIGVDDVANGFIFFGIASAIVTCYAYLANEK